MNNERQVEPDQVVRCVVQIVDVILIAGPCWCGRKPTVIGGDSLLYGKEGGLKLYFDVPAALHLAILLMDIGPTIKSLFSLKGLLQYFNVLHAIQAKETVILAQKAVADQLPVTFPPYDTVWFDLAVSDFVVMGTVVEGDTLVLPDCLTQADEQRGISP